MGIRMAPSYANLYIGRLIWIIYWNTTYSNSFSYFYSYFGTLCFIQSSPASDHPWFSGVDLISKYELISNLPKHTGILLLDLLILDITIRYWFIRNSNSSRSVSEEKVFNFREENTVLLISGRAYTVVF